MNKLPLFLLCIISGCGYIEVKTTDKVNTLISQSVSKNEANDLADKMSDVSKKDCLIIYKQFAGLAEFLENTDSIKNTSDLFKVIEDFQTEYSYTREKYESYTDAVEEFLTKRNYSVKNIVDKVKDTDNEIAKSQVIDDMRILGQAAKLAMDKKK